VGRTLTRAFVEAGSQVTRLDHRDERRPSDPDSGRRQRAAVAASTDRRPALATLPMPALVIHGEEDVMMRPEAGRATAAAIPGARLMTCPGASAEQ
jgi:pimeloyl-ACP methyl ester carboxylesterase